MARKKKKKGFLKRWLMAAAGALFVFLLCLFLVGVIWLKPLVKKAIESYGPEAFGADVQVEDVSISLFGGTAKVRGLVINNPQGYKEPVAIDAQELDISLRLRSLFSDTVVIEDMLLKSPVITYEKRKGVTNLTQLQNNALDWAKSLSSKEDTESSKKVIIKRFRIQDGTLRVKLPALPAVPVKLADIERRNIGGEGSDAQNFGHAVKDVLASVQLNASDAVSSAGGAIEKAAMEALKTGEGVLKTGEKVLDDAGDALKGLFK